jgi:hypothetical protein
MQVQHEPKVVFKFLYKKQLEEQVEQFETTLENVIHPQLDTTYEFVINESKENSRIIQRF